MDPFEERIMLGKKIEVNNNQIYVSIASDKDWFLEKQKINLLEEKRANFLEKSHIPIEQTKIDPSKEIKFNLNYLNKRNANNILSFHS